MLIQTFRTVWVQSTVLFYLFPSPALSAVFNSFAALFHFAVNNYTQQSPWANFIYTTWCDAVTVLAINEKKMKVFSCICLLTRLNQFLWPFRFTKPHFHTILSEYICEVNNNLLNLLNLKYSTKHFCLFVFLHRRNWNN